MTAKRQLTSYSVQRRNRISLHKYRKSGNLNNRMKENWEINWKDYYQILQVHPSAEPEIIKINYHTLRKYHPDFNPGKEKWANEKFKEINEAYAILSDTEKRKRYDSAYSQRMKGHDTSVPPTPPPAPHRPATPPIKPKPEINPTTIRFTDMIPGETRKDTFLLKNSGGHYSKIWMSKEFYNPNSWLNIVSQKPLYGTGKLPLLVEIEVKGDDWGKTYLDDIIVKLDDVETTVRVELRTRVKIEQANQSENKPMPTFKENESPAGHWALWLVGLLGIPVGLIYGIIKWFIAVPKHHLIYFLTSLISIVVLSIAVIEHDKGKQHRATTLTLLTLEICSALVIAFIPEMNWFFITFAIIIGLILLARYTSHLKKEHRETIMLIAFICLILGVALLLIHPNW